MSIKSIEPIICPAEANGKIMNFHQKLGTILGLTNSKELYLWASSSRSEYLFCYGNAEYSVSKIHFYDPEGRVYTNPNGFFGYWEGETSYRYRGISFKTDQKLLKRVKLSRDFNWKKTYYQATLFFVSRGRMGYTKPQAEVYIPFSYLRNLGFIVEVSEFDHNDDELLQVAKLVTPKFSMVIGQEVKLKGWKTL